MSGTTTTAGAGGATEALGGDAWIARRWFTPSGALVAEAAAGVDPLTVFGRLAAWPHCLFLDSALGDEPAAGDAAPVVRLGRHSFVAADPIHSLVVPSGRADAAGMAAAFAGLRGMLADLRTETIPGLPPFQGGLAGLVSYDGGLALLGLGAPPAAGPAVPALSLHLYDVVFAWDHDLGRGWFISQGLPARGPVARGRRAGERLAALLAPAPGAAPSPPGPPPPAPGARTDAPALRSTHDASAYRRMVQAGIEFVRAGDVFQVNLAQQFHLPAAVDPVELHLRARRVNPAPFAAAFAAGDAHVVSMSPERFLQVCRGVVRMHPIKGTRRVIASPEADLFAGDDLAASDKDRAENVMIVDLVRNDLARVCTPASVRVEALCRLERYRYVQHLVSVVAGRLRPGLGPLDALAAALPGGSVTGAPKHRACEIISTLEGAARGAYCGALGYVGCDGSADFNLLIRTFVVGPDAVTFAAGGGVTAASDPAGEHAESLAKAEGMLRALAALATGGDGR